MVHFDHYKEAQELSIELRKEKLNTYADQIMQAMEEGATGTEIFMALNWSIKKLLKINGLPFLIKRKAARLNEELEKALQ